VLPYIPAREGRGSRSLLAGIQELATDQAARIATDLSRLSKLPAGVFGQSSRADKGFELVLRIEIVSGTVRDVAVAAHRP